MAKFQKGQIANPKGSDGGKSKNDRLIREQLIPYAKEFVANLVKLTRSEDESVSLSATKDALDRLYGKAPQSVEVSGKDGLPFRLVIEGITGEQ